MTPWASIIKPSDTVRSNTNALAADPHLQFALAASTRYAVRGKVFFDTGATSDFKWRHAGPAGATVRLRRAWIVGGGTAFAGIAIDTVFSAADLAVAGTGASGWIEFEGVIVTGVAGGTFSFDWAQNAASAVQPSTVLAGSYIEYTKVPARVPSVEHASAGWQFLYQSGVKVGNLRRNATQWKIKANEGASPTELGAFMRATANGFLAQMAIVADVVTSRQQAAADALAFYGLTIADLNAVRTMLTNACDHILAAPLTTQAEVVAECDWILANVPAYMDAFYG